ncbi:MAG: DUF2190 family protein [Desulfurellales bacterium]|nr:MAG: DUF2190 family protein [Desulfurellales bacterium]
MEQSLVCITVEAGQDLSAKQYFFMSVASDGQIDPTGDGALADGVLQNTPDAAGKAATLAISGVSRVKAGAGVTKGDLVASDASGKVVTAATNDQILGKALATASGDGSIIPVLLKLSGEATKA